MFVCGVWVRECVCVFSRWDYVQQSCSQTFPPLARFNSSCWMSRTAHKDPTRREQSADRPCVCVGLSVCVCVCACRGVSMCVFVCACVCLWVCVCVFKCVCIQMICNLLMVNEVNTFKEWRLVFHKRLSFCVNVQILPKYTNTSSSNVMLCAGIFAGNLHTVYFSNVCCWLSITCSVFHQ